LNRLGIEAASVAGLTEGLTIALLMTHLACADEPGHPMNQRQLERFERVRRQLPDVPVSIGNSAGVLTGPASAGDVGRPGIALYGGNPFLGRPTPVSPVATLEGQVLQVRRVCAGESVGYGATYTASDDRDVAIVGLGYADGLPRLLSNRGMAGVDGRRCAIVGRVSMDLTAVDVTGARVAPGDWLEFLGATILVDEVAAWAETIAYEVLTGLGRRARRILAPA
jgi:alanine racemase